jgi:hypothetical protein
MKFGKVLQQSQQMSSSGWEERWVDYKRLKKIIKDCAQISKDEKLKAAKHPTKIAPSTRTDNESIRESEDEMNFFRTLRAEINKITDFFIKEQAKYTSQVKEIEHTFEELKALPRTNVKTELMKSCVTLYKELLLLENFAVMNFCGISKILKKHDKWTGYATRHKFMHTILMKQPFATYCPLLSMINRLEQIFMQTTGYTINQQGIQEENGHHTTTLDDTTTNPNGVQKEILQTTTTTTNHMIKSNSSNNNTSGKVSLVRVQSLRDDVRQLKKMEECDDADDEYDEDADGDEEKDQHLYHHTNSKIEQQEKKTHNNNKNNKNNNKKRKRKACTEETADSTCSISTGKKK